MRQQCWHSHPINHSRDWLYPIPRAPWVDPTIRCACEMDTMSSILSETPFQVHCTLTPTIWSVFEVMTFLHHQSCSTHSIGGAPHGCMMLILFIEWQEVMSCRGPTKASSHQTGLSWTSDTGKWTLTWYVLTPLRLNPWKCRNPFSVDPIRVRTTFLTKFYNKTGTIMPSFLKVFNPLFSGPIRVRATFLTKSYNKTGTITSSFLKVSNPLFNDAIRVRTTFLSESYNKTGTIAS